MAARRRPGPVLCVPLAAVLLAGCTGGGASDVPTGSLAEVTTTGVDAAHAAADVAFAQSMLALHHQQDELAATALLRSDDRRVRRLAATADDDREATEQLVVLLSAWGAPLPGGMEVGPAPEDGEDPAGGEPVDEEADGPAAVALVGADEVADVSRADDAHVDDVLLGLWAEQHRSAAALVAEQLDSGRNPQALALAAELGETHAEQLAEVEKLLRR